MTVVDDFADDRRLTEYLAHQLVHGRLALVLGAGISMPFGLPDWTQLLQNLYAKQGEAPPNKPPEQQAEYLRLKFFQNDPQGFVQAIHETLYASVTADFVTLRANGTLAAIASLVMASRRGSVPEVITFNFDDLLEIFLSYHGFVVAPVFRRKHWVHPADVTVYHPHGVIPFDPNQERSHGDEVVFDQSSYSSVVGKAADPWRQTVLTILRRRTCLFIGLSGADDNLDSLMTECREQHASLDENTAYWGITFSASDDDVARRLWQARGVFYNKIADYAQDLPDKLFAICQKAAQMRCVP